MKIQIVLATLLTLSCAAFAEEPAPPASAPPQWFIDHVAYMTRDGGRWTADNAAFKGENEAWDAYGVEFVAGPGGGSMSGRLFGLTAGNESEGDFWIFSEFWDPKNKRVVVQQYGWGAVGIGTAWMVGDSEYWTRQTFTAFDGRTYDEGHRFRSKGPDLHETVSFGIDPTGQWSEKRTYSWVFRRAQTASD